MAQSKPTNSRYNNIDKSTDVPKVSENISHGASLDCLVCFHCLSYTALVSLSQYFLFSISSAVKKASKWENKIYWQWNELGVRWWSGLSTQLNVLQVAIDQWGYVHTQQTCYRNFCLIINQCISKNPCKCHRNNLIQIFSRKISRANLPHVNFP